MAQLDPFLWLAVLGGILGFVYAFGIGANDVANSFASSVSSGSLSLKQAVVIAGIFEFLGAILLGASVTGTIRAGIFKSSYYEGEPEIVLLGMFTSLLVGTFMLLTATYFSLPVSTTHTIVGSIMGFSVVAKGWDSLNWDVVILIIVSWVASPVGTGIVAAIFFGLLKCFVLSHPDAVKRSFWAFPVVLTVFVGVDFFFILFKGLNNVAEFKLAVVLPCSFGAGLVLGLIWIFIIGPRAMRRIETAKAERANKETVHADGEQEEVTGEKPADEEAGAAAEESVQEQAKKGEPAPLQETAPTTWHEKFAARTYGQDLKTQSMHESHRANEIWEAAEKFDEDAEQLFTYVQVATACLNSFAHGANDVSNAIAPLSACIFIYQSGTLATEHAVQKWVLAYGGIALALGFFLYGYKIIKSIGYKISMLSPSRGASAELASSLFVVLASFLGIPVSSTQCIVGAVTGVGLVGGLKNIQWIFLLRVCCGWAVVFFAAALLNAGVFAMFAYSPSLV